jgi:pimeloyl-ACP methyl ester carboxylesterase
MRILVAALALATGAVLVPAAAVSSAAADSPDPRPAGLPDGVPAAATRAEPTLATPRGWPFEQRLSRTSGTGRLHGGASYWTDFVHDDHGAAIPSGATLDNTARLAPYQGVFTYDDPAARGNGADVFVAAVGVDRRASYWRVDWNTLADPTVPLAVWGLDTDADASTGTDTWPAGAGVTSAGLDQALIVSGRDAWVQDLTTRRSRNVENFGGRLTVDRSARSFVVRVPKKLLPVSGSWRVRLVAGLADFRGRAFAPASISGVRAGAYPRVYNVGFRTARQEPAVYTSSNTAALVAAYQRLAAGTSLLDQVGADGQARFVTGNFWAEDHQADALASGDVTPFSHRVRWRALQRERSTPEPLVRGHSNRWYVSRLRLGQGVVADSGGATGDGEPNFLGRIQPYAVYVPRSYRRGSPAPLTWTLHSLSVNHNQYAAYDPMMLRRLCEERGSICAGTLGHGPDGWYFDEAEADYWQVWGALARSFTLDPRRTVVGGYSMGGWASYKLGLTHPDLYAGAYALAGPPQCGVSVDASLLVNPAFGERCTSDGNAYDLVGNALHLPYRIGQGQLDQLVPFTSVEVHVQRFSALGLEHRFVRYPGEDHLLFATQDRFETTLGGLGTPKAVRNPRDIDFTWHPHLTRRDLGIGATTAYWLRDLRSRTSAPGSVARVAATSRALPGTEARVVRTGPTPVASPLPAIRQDLVVEPGAALPRSKRLVLDLTGVRSLTVDLARAGMPCGRVQVSSDGRTRVRFDGARSGDRTVVVGAGERRFRVC